MATIDWPSTLALALVSGAPIREKGLVGWWSMNRTALDGAVLRDDSGSGNDGTIYGATPVDGVSGKALSFDGVDDWVDTGYTPTPAESLSLCGWFRVPSSYTWNTSAANFIFGGQGSIRGIGLLRVTSNNNVAAAIRTDSGNTVGAAYVIDRDVWYQFSVVYDASGTLSLYINDALVSTVAAAYSDFEPASITIGRYLFTGTGSAYQECDTDELRIYTRALTAEEVAARYTRVTSYQALPEFPMPDGFSETVQDGALRSRSDSGLEKIRRRFTATPTLYSTRYQLTAEQKQLLDYFYRTTTRGGTLRFNWTHPHGYPVEARFRAPPVYTATDVEVIADVRLEVAA